MPSPKPSDDEKTPTKAKPVPNARRVSVGKGPRNGGSGIRKASGNRTPVRKSSATQARTPNSAPAAVRKTPKKAEPTLFSDFLLGRPSPQRTRTATRRKSLDALKKEMKLEADAIGKVPNPGGVKDRVKQWQKASAAELAAKKVEEEKAESDGEWEDDKSKSGGGSTKPRPGRRKGGEAEDDIPIGGTAKEAARGRSRSAGSPKKKVIGDDQWMKKPEKKKSPPRKSPPRKGQPIPKHFAALTNNPPLEKKIKDWARRNASEESETPPPSAKILKQRTPSGTPRKEALPKDFPVAASTPPLEKRINDWAQRSVSEGPEEIQKTPKSSKRESVGETPRRRRTSRQNSPDKDSVDEEFSSRRRRRASRQNSPDKDSVDEEFSSRRRRRASRQKSPHDDSVDEDVSSRKRRVPREEQVDNALKSRDSSRQSPFDDGIRVRPSPDHMDGGIQAKSSRDFSFNSADDGLRIPHEPSSRRRSKPDNPRKRSDKYLEPLDSEGRQHEPTTLTGDTREAGDDNDASAWTPSRKRSRRHPRRSDTVAESLDEIPFGNSAFSVLDMPVGAEAGTMRRPPPNRTPSFGMPKVFKKVYSEAINIVHDTVDPPRAGPNQPPSIESWLKGTTDPFVEAPATPKSMPEAQELSPSRTRDYKENDTPEQNLAASVESGVARKRHVRSPHDLGDRHRVSNRDSPSTARETLPSMGKPPSLSPNGLKRTPATRSTSPPKLARKSPLKEALLDAFRGESTTYRSKGGPLQDISDSRENRSPSGSYGSGREGVEERVPKNSPREPEDTTSKPTHELMPPPVFPRRPAPTTGVHRLSTIASVETFSTKSSAAETASGLSQTTVTEDTLSTLPTESNLSRKSNKSGLKRRLTKHADLLSVLSLPDSAPPGKATSIRSARSIRTSRAPFETARIPDFMRELADDESKYIRELDTLVDGVIPVLLSSVLSKSETAIAAGIFDANPDELIDSSFTKPIVDMGIALEHLRSLHKRIPLGDPEGLTSWAHSAHKSYDDYLVAWRMGFQGAIVNLAPATSPSSTEEQSALYDMPRNANGDMVNADGERVDVAFLLRRPLVRIKYLSRVLKGINRIDPTDRTRSVDTMWEDLVAKARRRTKEEQARMVDRAAYNTDATRARDPRTLALAENTKIDRTRQVYAKDHFSLDMPHSSGQRIECEVELLLRDKPSAKKDPGDVLVCAVDDISRWLLFTPISRDVMSARMGDSDGQVVVLVRGVDNLGQNWQETFILETDDYDAAKEWVEMLGTAPIPPPILPKGLNRGSPTSLPSKDIEIPIGERRRREAEEIASMHQEQQGPRYKPTVYDLVKEEPVVSPASAKDHGQPKSNDEEKPAINHARARSSPRHRSDSKARGSPDSEAFMSGALPFIPEASDESLPTPDHSSPDDQPPPPPTHRTPTTPKTLKPSPVLETPTPKGRNPRISSPLKHEYRPSNGSDTSESEYSDSPDQDSSSESSDEELEEEDIPEPQFAPISPYSKRLSPPRHNLPNSTLAPSNAVSQGPYRGVPLQRSSASVKLTAMVSSWNNAKGRWDDIHPEPCSIIVSPGLIEAFEMNACHSSPPKTGSPLNSSGTPDDQEDAAEADRPLVGLVLTPMVNLRKSTGVDIEIHSPPTSYSRLKCSSSIRYRSISPQACNLLYNTIHKARLENPVWVKLEQERIVNDYGSNTYEAAVEPSRRRFFFGRRKSYRASARAPSAEPSERSHSSSAFSRLRRMSGGGLFNIAKSSIHTGAKGNISVPGSSYGSRYSGNSDPTPPGTPPSLSLAPTNTSGGIHPLGNENLKIRLYCLVRGLKWDDKGSALLTITQPRPGTRQASSLYNGIEKRIIVSIKIGKAENDYAVVLDEVLGSACFSRLGRMGIVVNVWEDIRGDRGEIGRVGRVGGVSGRIRKWLFQTGSSREAAWIFGLTQRSALSY